MEKKLAANRQVSRGAPDEKLCEQDQKLCEQIERALRSTGHFPLREVQVLVHEGYVRLHGQVPSYYMKQLAQFAAMSVDGVVELDNKIVVVV